MKYFDRNFHKDFVDNLIGNGSFETSGRNYLKTLAAQEAVYQSANINELVAIKSELN